MKIIIGGAGAVGTHLAKLLSREKQDCVLIDEDSERLGGLDSSYDMMTMQGSPTSIQTLKDAGCEHADLFVGVTPEERSAGSLDGDFTLVEKGIAVYTYLTNHPVNTHCVTSEIVLPSYENMDSVFVMKVA